MGDVDNQPALQLLAQPAVTVRLHIFPQGPKSGRPREVQTSPLAGVWVTRVAQRLAQFQARRGADFDAVSKLERDRQCNGDSNSENFRTGSILQRTVVHMKCPRRLQYRDALQVGQVQCDALTRRDETLVCFKAPLSRARPSWDRWISHPALQSVCHPLNYCLARSQEEDHGHRGISAALCRWHTSFIPDATDCIRGRVQGIEIPWFSPLPLQSRVCAHVKVELGKLIAGRNEDHYSTVLCIWQQWITATLQPALPHSGSRNCGVWHEVDPKGQILVQDSPPGMRSNSCGQLQSALSRPKCPYLDRLERPGRLDAEVQSPDVVCWWSWRQLGIANLDLKAITCSICEAGDCTVLWHQGGKIQAVRNRNASCVMKSQACHGPQLPWP
mmetsp:Transcript_23759/g.55974  ORF Transcript_23759/g.55974 Transcript_23759/m.55974 type:complete len:386 (-) Transcript_23759:91-1248(-)